MEGHLLNSDLQRAEPNTTPVYVRERLPPKEEEWSPETNQLRMVIDSVGETAQQHQHPPSSSAIVRAHVGMGNVVPVATSLNREEKTSLGSLLEPLQVSPVCACPRWEGGAKHSDTEVPSLSQGHAKTNKQRPGRDTSKLDPSVIEATCRLCRCPQRCRCCTPLLCVAVPL